VALVTVAALAHICQLPGTISFIMIPISLLGCVIGSVVVLATTVVFIANKHPRRGISIFLALLLPVLLWRPIVWAADLAHLGLTVGFGAGQLGISTGPKGGDFATYDWSVGFAGGPSTILIHDVTDEIALPVAQHTRPLSVEDGFGEECAGKVDHLVSHYYVCTI